MPGIGGIFTLDLSSRTGWAYGCIEDRQPVCGVWVLPTGDLGRMFASFENELEDAIALHRPSLLMVEAPLPPTAVSNASTWEHQLGLSAMAQSTAYRNEIPLRQQAASTIRAAILGTARFPGGNAKQTIMAWCAAQGWTVPDHNAGDACITWQYSRLNAPRRRNAA